MRLHSAGQKYWLLAAVLMAVAATVWRVEEALTTSLWRDELATVRRMLMPDPLAVIRDSLDAAQPPLYHLLIWLWGQWVGVSDLTARLPSLLLYALTLWCLVVIARRLFDTPTAVLAVAIFCISPVTHYYAVEARAYGLTMLLGLLTIYQGLRLQVLTPAVSGRGPWLVYGLLCVLVVLLNYVSAFFVLGLGLALVFHAGSVAGAKAALVMLARHVAIAGVCVPVPVLHMLYSGSSPWLAAPGAEALAEAVGMLGHTLYGGRLLLMGLAVMLVWGLMTWWRRWPRWPQQVWLLVIMALAVYLPVVAAAVFSWLIEPVLFPRYLLAGLPAATLVIAGLTLIMVPGRSWRIAMVVLVPLALAAELFLVSSYLKQPRRNDLEAIARHAVELHRATEGDIPMIVCSDGVPTYFALHDVTMAPLATGCRWSRVAAFVAREVVPRQGLILVTGGRVLGPQMEVALRRRLGPAAHERAFDGGRVLHWPVADP